MSRPGGAGRARTAYGTGAALFALVLAVAGCGTTPAATGPAGSPAPSGIAAPALATSLATAGGASWAVVQMGGSAAQHDNFWELFARPAGAPGWKLATPVGVASNGGLVATVTGTSSLLAGFRPSQDLSFSPLASTTDAGADWSQATLIDPGLAGVPGALTRSGDGRLLAITDTGDAETGTGAGTGWARLTTERALGGTAAGRACGLTALTAAAWTPAGQPLLAGDCGKGGVAGILTLSGGAWRAAAPALPATLAHDPVSVIGLAAEGTHITAVLAAGTGPATVVITAWSADGGSNWSLSPQLRTGTATSSDEPSVSFGAAGSASLALPGSSPGAAGRGATIGWQAAGWQELPPLPAGTATLAATAAGQPEAIAARGGTMTAWQLSSSAGTSRWMLLQTVRVTIPYGSSS